MSVSPGMGCPFSIQIVKIHHRASGIFSSLKLEVTFASLSSVRSALSDLLCLAARSCVYFIPRHQTAHSAPSLSPCNRKSQRKPEKPHLALPGQLHLYGNVICESRLFLC